MEVNCSRASDLCVTGGVDYVKCRLKVDVDYYCYCV